MDVFNFLEQNHQATKRNYIKRVVDDDKAACAVVAVQWAEDYWDGDRKFGYGGYSYDGRWHPVAEKISNHYDLKAGDRILDIGCGKGHLLYEFTQVRPGITVAGIDISDYGIENARKEICSNLQVGDCASLPYEDNEFDFVYSLNTFHNLRNFDLKSAVEEMERVSKGKSYLCIESYRNEKEKVNLLYWQLTCRSFYSTEEWEWLMTQYGFTGDIGYIFFE